MGERENLAPADTPERSKSVGEAAVFAPLPVIKAPLFAGRMMEEDHHRESD